MAAKPYNADVMEKVVERLRTEQHRTVQLEAATALAYGEAQSKATDLAGLQPIPSSVLYVLTKAMPVMQFFAS